MKKVVIFINDGVSLRNFIFSNFLEVKKDFEIEIWYDLPVTLKLDGCKTYKTSFKTNAFTDLLKSSYIYAKLKDFAFKLNEEIFNDYIFPDNKKGIKNTLKRSLKNLIAKIYKNRPEEILKLIELYEKNFVKQNRHFLNRIELFKPDMFFFTSQRSSAFFSTISIAKKNNIQTATFIFSWDNPPKATLLYNTDYFFVWSDFMKNEILKYYNFVNKNQIMITGTPQFEFHFNKRKLESSSLKKLSYVCFTGDDITSSPQDDLYLNDFATQISKFNTNTGNNIKIIFRPCPVDFSNRYDWVLELYSDLIIKIQPKWDKIGNHWNSVIPKKEDNDDLSYILSNSIFVTNLGSSIVFDAACYSVPCAYINYNPNPELILKDVNRAYRYKHFDSMKDKDSVYWVNKPSDWYRIIEERLMNLPQNTVAQNAQQWFASINQHPPQKASERIVEAIEKILS